MWFFVFISVLHRQETHTNTHLTCAHAYLHACTMHTQTLLPPLHTHTHRNTQVTVIYCEKVFFSTNGKMVLVSKKKNNQMTQIRAANGVSAALIEQSSFRCVAIICASPFSLFSMLFAAQCSCLTATALTWAERGTSGACQLIFKTAWLR